MIWIIIISIVFLLFVIVYIKPISRKILEKSGWEPPSKELIEMMEKYKKLVIVYPHTSHLDGVMMLLYKKAYPEFGQYLKFLIRPDITEFPLVGRFLIQNGAVPSTLLVIKNGGRTKEIIQYLNTIQHFHFLISPKGTVRKSPWKTGYYYIAKGTDAHVVPIGLDYSSKKIIFSDPYPISGSSNQFPTEEVLSSFLKEKLRHIPQYYPERVEY